MMMITKVYL